VKVVQDIERLGFRRWYERQLIEGHLYLVFAFLVLIAMLAGIEMLDLQRSAPAWGGLLLLCAGGGLLVLIAWRRFMTLMGRAELFANGAACPRCAAYGKFRVISAEAASDDEPVEAGRPHWVRVACRRCGESWRLG
jgi:hypothetical protein